MTSARLIHAGVLAGALFVSVPAGADMLAAGGIAGSTIAAHPTVRGQVAPLGTVQVSFVYPVGVDEGRFTGTVVARTGRYVLPPPDEPADLFLFRVRAVFFPRPASHGAAIVVLYRVVQTGPGNDPENRALVYAFRKTSFVRIARLERRLEGVVDATTARTRLGRVT